MHCVLCQVSTGETLRENNLKEIEGGRILDSQGVLVANKRALKEQPGLLAIAHELIERLEARLSCLFIARGAIFLSPNLLEAASALLSSDACGASTVSN